MIGGNRPIVSCFSLTTSTLLFSFILINRFLSIESISCNSEYYPNYGAGRYRAVLECDFGVCYGKYVFKRSPGSSYPRLHYVESGCSTEFHHSMIGKCVGDTRQGYTCVCNNASYCNYDYRQLDGPDPHRRVVELPLRHLSCFYNDAPETCHEYGFSSGQCNISSRSFCEVGRPMNGDYIQRGSVDYVGYFERANAELANSDEWLCEEDEYEQRWLCTCRANGCSANVISELARSGKIDRSTATVQCREYDSTLVEDASGQNRTCFGHVCYAEYDRTVIPLMITDEYDSDKHDAEPKVADVRLTLGCRNFSHPRLFYGWSYNKVYGNKQKGQMFCHANMCNDFSLQTFRNASYRLEASAAASPTVNLFSMASVLLVLLVTAMLSISSG